MEDNEKTKEQLINELAKLRQQITKLKESEIKRKKAEEDLKKSQQEFASLFKNSSEALVYTDEKGNILDINPYFTALFGYTLDEIKGRNIDDGMIIPPDKMKEAKKLTSEALKEDFYFETVRKKKNGTLFPVAISGSRVIIGGRFKGLIASYRDITERQKMIDDLKNSEEKYRSL
ncbi:PAS domain S-box protein, partial [bacterium]|nr:PAS domain S-box protein [bacterium]